MTDHETTAIAVSDYATPTEMRASLTRQREQLSILQDFVREVMVPSTDGKADGDYGIIPGTDKPTLLKPGAEKLAELYGYSITIPDIAEEADRETGYYRARVTVRLVARSSGVPIGDGVGEANTYEGRYRWRNAQKRCPNCGAEAVIKGKAEFGGGWLCWTKKGGCDTKWPDGAEAIERQPVGKVENEDLHSMWNTVLKMAKKRALIDAVLSCTRSSALFTQDMEDHAPPPAPSASAQRQPAPPRNSAPRRSQRDYAAEADAIEGKATEPEQAPMPDAGDDFWSDINEHMKAMKVTAPDMTKATGVTFNATNVRAYADAQGLTAEQVVAHAAEAKATA